MFSLRHMNKTVLVNGGQFELIPALGRKIRFDFIGSITGLQCPRLSSNGIIGGCLKIQPDLTIGIGLHI